MIDFVVSEPHFADHLYPIWKALKDPGDFILTHELISTKIQRWEGWNTGTDNSRPVVVASYGDHKRARRLGRTRIARLEHGAGQNYIVPRLSASYAGGPDAHDLGLMMVPNQYSADLWQAAYPDLRVEIVGCPKLDTLPRKDPAEPLTVAISYHWDCHLVPETVSAFETFRSALEPLNAAYNLIGHGHPRAWVGPPSLEKRYRRAGIEAVRDFDEVCRRADVYVCDNSCVTPETLVLDAELRWRPAGSLLPGDRIIGCDEEATREGRLKNGVAVQREDRRLRTTTVVANERKVMPCLTVETDRGTLTVSSTHPYLVRRSVPHTYTWPKTGWVFKRSHQQWQWVEARDIQPGDEVAHLIEPWQDAADRDSGWLAGMFDGEGNIHIATPKQGSQHRRLSISVSQNRGKVLDELHRLLTARGLTTVAQTVGGTAKGRKCQKLTVAGRLMERLRLLGELRPIRLLTKALEAEVWDGVNVSANVTRAKVLSVTDAGRQEVCVVQTEHKTLIAGGFMAHNSSIYEFAATGRPVVVMNSRSYRKDVNHGLRFWDAIPGAQVSRPGALLEAVARALQDPPELRKAREQALAKVYPIRTGAAERAARVLEDWA